MREMADTSGRSESNACSKAIDKVLKEHFIAGSGLELVLSLTLPS